MNDTPQAILKRFGPYVERFPVIRVSRDSATKEVKCTTSIYAEWALLVFKSLYPPTSNASPNLNLTPTTQAHVNKVVVSVLTYEPLKFQL
jgi:hypothetical protein